MTKIDIISGFLGAGKTTFIKKILKEAVSGEQVVLIENEFGEIGIDGGFLKDSGIEIREMNSGCICCSLVGDFAASLSEVLAKYHPDRVIIEPSGVGKLSDVMKAVREASLADVVLNSAVTVVDVQKCKMYMKNFGEFFNNQIENAGTIVLSRTDLAEEKKVEQAIALIRQKNEKAAIVTTPMDCLSGEQLLQIIEKTDDLGKQLLEEVKEMHTHHHHDHGHEEHSHSHGDGCSCGCDHDHHHADEVFTSWGMEHVPACTRESLDAILDELAYGDGYGDVLRAKGMIPGAGQADWFYFDLVPEQYEIRSGNPDFTGRVCVIGANLDIENLKKVFGETHE